MKNKYSKICHLLKFLFLISLLTFSCSDAAKDNAMAPADDLQYAPTSIDEISGAELTDDTILIRGVLPASGLIDNTETLFIVVVEYLLISAESGELNIGFNTENVYVYTIIEDASIEITSGHGYHTFIVEVTVKDWGQEGSFNVYVGLAQTVESDEASLPLTNDYSENLMFE